MCDFYIQSANVIDKLLQKKGSIKGLSFQSSPTESKSKTTYALVCETLKYKDVIDELMVMVPQIKDEKVNKVKYSTLLVMIYDLLFSQRQSIAGGGHAKKTILSFKVQLSSALARLKIKHRVSNNVDLLPESIRNPIVLPRYVRININGITNNSSKDYKEVIDRFIKEGYTLATYQGVELPQIPNGSNGMKIDFGDDNKRFYQDNDFKEILIFSGLVDLHDHELLHQGKIILQDKASCLPAYVLNPPENVVCIDSCSAPGNKTSLVSAQMKNTGKIYAIEKDLKRMNTLIRLTTRSKCKNIEAVNGSFLDLKHDDPRFEDVEYILCDPSCSGSGIVNRLDYLLSSTIDGPNSNVADENDDIVDELIKNSNDGKALTPKAPTSIMERQQQQQLSKTALRKTLDREEKKQLKKEVKKRKHDEYLQLKNRKKPEPKEDAQPAEEVIPESKRMELLADFQLSIIRHAFAFPCVKRVVYSTCSVHQIENEDVVQKALNELNKVKETWRLVNILPHWKKSRGLSLFKNSEYCLRLSPQNDNTIGFFVACFEKINPKPTSGKKSFVINKTPSTIPPTKNNIKQEKEENNNSNLISSSKDIKNNNQENNKSNPKKQVKEEIVKEEEDDEEEENNETLEIEKEDEEEKIDDEDEEEEEDFDEEEEEEEEKPRKKTRADYNQIHQPIKLWADDAFSKSSLAKVLDKSNSTSNTSKSSKQSKKPVPPTKKKINNSSIRNKK